MGNASSVVKGEQGPVTQALGVLSEHEKQRSVSAVMIEGGGCGTGESKEGQSANDKPTDIAITQDKKEILFESWEVLNNNLDVVGMDTFNRMFETHPEALKHIIPHLTSKAIPRKGLTESLDHWHSEKLREHAQRIMAIVGQVVRALTKNDKAKIEKMLQGLGRRHYGFGVHVDILQLMGPHFIASIYPQLKDMWSDEMQEAWVTLFNMLIHHMRIGYNAQRDMAMANKAPKPSWRGYFD